MFAFKSSAVLGYAYGMAVTRTITITTLLYFYIARHQWGKPLWLIIPGPAALLTVDLLFLAADLTKFVHGAWLPLLIGIVAFTVFTTWQRGRVLVTRIGVRDEGPLPAFIDKLRTVQPPLARVPGIAVFLNRGKDTATRQRRAQPRIAQVRHRAPNRNGAGAACPGRLTAEH